MFNVRRGVFVVAGAILSLMLCVITSTQAGTSVIDDTACEQYQFPHGMVNNVFVNGDFAFAASSWSRGFGVIAFDMTEPEKPLYALGVPSLGYIMSSAVKGDIGYFATTFSVCVVRLPKKKGDKIELIENILIGFPSNGADKVKIAGNNLYVQSRDAMRVYDITVPDTPVLKKTITDIGDIHVFEPVEDPDDNIVFYYVRKDNKKQMAGYGMNKKFELAEKDFNDIDFVEKKYLPSVSNSRFSVSLNDKKELVTKSPSGEILSAFPIIFNEGPVITIGDYAYSITPVKDGYFLYGFDISKKPRTGEGVLFDKFVFYPSSQEKRRFNVSYDIVLPPAALLVKDNYLFAPQGLLDISDASNLRFIGNTTPYPACAMSLSPDGKTLVMAQGALASIFDVSQLPELKLIAEITPSEKVKGFYDVVTDGINIFLWSKNNLAVYDAKTFKPIAEYPADTVSYSILKHGKYLYLPPVWNAKTRDLIVLDVSKPSDIIEVDRIPDFIVNGTCQAKIRDGKMYVSDGDKIKVFSLENPEKPNLIKTYSGYDIGAQSYNYFDFSDDKLAAKKYPRFDVWNLDDKGESSK